MFVEALIIAFVVNILFFLIAFVKKSDAFTDMTYSLTFIILAWFAYLQSPKDWIHLLATVMVTFWAIRLGGFLLKRVLHMGKDARFDGIRNSFFSFLEFWLAQAVTAWVLLLPLFFLSTHSGILTIYSLAGFGVWLAGLLIESIADWQKFVFKKKHPKKLMISGLFAWSRHPNYFGEILVWIGFAEFVFPVLSPMQVLFSLISPLFIIVVLRFFTGVPVLEKSYEKKYGAQWRVYKKNTSMFMLLPKH